MKTPVIEITPNVETTIITALRELKVPANVLGYEYLKIGLTLVLSDPTYLGRMTRGLYPDIAAQVGSTASRVERALRHAVEIIFDRAKPGDFEDILGFCPNAMSGKVPNSEFLANVAENIRVRIGAYNR